MLVLPEHGYHHIVAVLAVGTVEHLKLVHPNLRHAFLS